MHAFNWCTNPWKYWCLFPLSYANNFRAHTPRPWSKRTFKQSSSFLQGLIWGGWKNTCSLACYTAEQLLLRAPFPLYSTHCSTFRRRRAIISHMYPTLWQYPVLSTLYIKIWMFLCSLYIYIPIYFQLKKYFLCKRYVIAPRPEITSIQVGLPRPM